MVVWLSEGAKTMMNSVANHAPASSVLLTNQELDQVLGAGVVPTILKDAGIGASLGSFVGGPVGTLVGGGLGALWGAITSIF
jgi:hypothetical protein